MTGGLRPSMLIAAAALFICASATSMLGQEKSLTIASWGGAYAQSQQIAYYRPFEKKTGVSITLVYHGGKPALLGKGREYRFGNWDVVDLSADALETGCRDGLLEPISKSDLASAKDGTSASKDFLTGALHECGVASVAWSSMIVFDKRAFKDKAPKSAADFFDLKNYPGKRALKSGARYTLELALLADGVAPAKVYAELGSKTGLERALKKLQSIEKHIVWWKRSDEPLKLLREGEVAMATAFNGRAFGSMVADNRALQMLWDGQVYTMDSWAIPKSSKNKQAAMKFISFATSPERLAHQARWFPYGPSRKSAVELVGNHAEIKMKMAAYLPTSKANLKRALQVDAQWWLQNEEAVEKKFSTWLAARSSSVSTGVRTSRANGEDESKPTVTSP